MTEKIKDNWNLWCKLFGHKFVQKVYTGEQIPGVYNPVTGAPGYYYKLVPYPFCSRCGTANPHYEESGL